jgi:hypothetical protein
MTSSRVSNLDFFEPLAVAMEVADVTEEFALETAPLLLVLLLPPLLFIPLLALLLALLQLLRPPDNELVELLAGDADRLPLPLGLCEGRIKSSLRVE